MNNIRSFFENDKFAEFIAIELLEFSEGSAMAQLEIKKEHLNGHGIVHGGVIFTLADFVFGVAANSHGKIAMGINASISYLKSVSKGILVATAREVSLNKKLATYTIDVTDEHGDTIAIFQGTVYRKREKIPIQRE